MEGAILNTFYPLVIYETFTLVLFHFFVPVLQIYMYLVLLTLDGFSDLVFKALVFCVDQ